MQSTNLFVAWGRFRGFVEEKTVTSKNVLLYSDLTWKYSPSVSGPQRNLSCRYFLISFACLLAQSADFLGRSEDAQKQNGLKICFMEWTLSARCAKLIRSSLREQSNGNGNLSSLKMKLIFPLRAYECSAKMCDSLFHCDCTEGILADVHSLLLLYIVYTFTVPDAWDYFTEQ